MAVFNTFGVMLDMSRDGVMTVPAIKDFVKCASEMGVDTFYIYMEDVYELKDYPMFGHLRGKYSVEELKEIDEFCASINVSVVPCIQTLGHLEQYLRYSNAEDIKDTWSILLCGEEKSYEFIEAMVKTMREAFRGKRLHIGMDESNDMGFGRYYTLNGYDDKLDIFIKHLKRVCSICEKYDFIPMIWDDTFYHLATRTEIDVKTLDLPYVELVPWNYGKIPEGKNERFDIDKRFSKRVVFANGAQTWGTLIPKFFGARDTVLSSAQIAADNGIKDIVLTFWGDDACQANYNLARSLILLSSEYNRTGVAPTDEELIAISEDLDMPSYAALKISGVFDDPLENGDINVGKRLMWGDILINSARIFEKEYTGILYDAYKKMIPFVERHDKWEDYYKYMALALKTVSLKCEILTNLRENYKKNNTEYLNKALNEIFPELEKCYHDMEKIHRVLWLSTYKPTGYQKVECRYGSQLMRLDFAKERIGDYISGKIAVIDELEEPVYPFNKRTDAYMCCRHLIDVSV